MTRFDKMQMKEKYEFRLEENPIVSKFRKIERVLGGILKREGMDGIIQASRR